MLTALAFYLKLGITYLLSACQIITGIVACNSCNEKRYFDEWLPSDSFSIEDNTIILEKDPNKDFVVLNLTDIQLSDEETFGSYGELAKATIDKLVNDTNPDLITLSGDNAYGWLANLWLINLLDSYKIPWAPVMGNHDGQGGNPNEAWIAYQLAYMSEYCLFKFGPKDMGYGNYIITIEENGRPVQQLYMMDTHSDAYYEDVDVSGYDHLWKNQIEWYKWAVNGTTAENGAVIESTVIYHIPNVEYEDAWNAAIDWSGESKFIAEYDGLAYGENNEGICSAPVNNGFFDIVKELGSTKNILCGHDHVNDFGIKYQGVWLRYSVKTGAGCYWDENLNGGTMLKVSSKGNVSAENVFINPTQLGVDYSVSYPSFN